MGACLTKDSIYSSQRKSTTSSGNAYPSIEDMYRKNKADMKKKNPKQQQTSAFDLPYVDDGIN